MDSFDADVVQRLVDYMTGPYKREVTVICEGCGRVGTMIEEMPAGFMSLGVPHCLCADCAAIVRRKTNEPNKNI